MFRRLCKFTTDRTSGDGPYTHILISLLTSLVAG